MYKSFLIICLLANTQVSAKTLNGKIVSISDGDTVTLLTVDQTQYKVRLAGIDAPEKTQAFGQRSKKALSDCAYLKPATIEGEKKDRYGRVIGKVIINGTDCNLRQIQLGLAWHYKKYQEEQNLEDREKYNTAELRARSDRDGLWEDVEPLAPWEFRKSKKKPKLIKSISQNDN